jgi:hypothetical protein
MHPAAVQTINFNRSHCKRELQGSGNPSQLALHEWHAAADPVLIGAVTLGTRGERFDPTRSISDAALYDRKGSESRPPNRAPSVWLSTISEARTRGYADCRTRLLNPETPAQSSPSRRQPDIPRHSPQICLKTRSKNQR